MSRRICAVFTLLCLMMALLAPAAPADSIDIEEALALFSGVYARTAFALPGTAELLPDADYPGVWTDSFQLFGNCTGDGAEFQLHCGNIEGLINQVAAQYPDEDPRGICLSALINYCMMIPNLYDAQIGELTPRYDEETGYLEAEIDFTYPDTPDVAYHCACRLSGNEALGLIVEKCPHTEQILGSLRYVSEEEAQQILSDKTAPVSMEMYGLAAVWPGPYTTIMEEDQLVMGCFTGDFSLLQISMVPVSVAVSEDEDGQMADMLAIAGRMCAGFETDNFIDPILTRPAANMLQLDFSAHNESVMGEYGPLYRCRLYAGEAGIFYVYTSDTATGQAFLDSLHLSGESSAARGETVIEGSHVFSGFRDNLNALLDTDAPAGGTGDFIWCSPILSGGRWSRMLISPALDAGVRVFVDSDGEDAAVTEVRLLRWDDSSLSREAFDILCRLCARALTGKEESLDPEYIEKEGSALAYERIVLLPQDPPAAAAPLPFPSGSIPPITGDTVTAAEFEKKCTALAPGMNGLDFSYAASRNDEEGNEVRGYILGNVMMISYLDGAGDEAPVSMVVAMGFDGEDAPQVVAAAMMAYAAIAALPEEQIPALAWTLMESPLWSDLADLWPLLCNGQVCAHLQQADGQFMGFVAGMAEN